MIGGGRADYDLDWATGGPIFVRMTAASSSDRIGLSQ